MITITQIASYLAFTPLLPIGICCIVANMQRTQKRFDQKRAKQANKT